jgi:hypothetical protein
MVTKKKDWFKPSGVSYIIADLPMTGDTVTNEHRQPHTQIKGNYARLKL